MCEREREKERQSERVSEIDLVRAPLVFREQFVCRLGYIAVVALG